MALYCVSELVRDAIRNGRQMQDGSWEPGRPMNIRFRWDRWREAWWAFTGRVDLVWWPEDGNPRGRAL
jgi:hypothetical protein